MNGFCTCIIPEESLTTKEKIEILEKNLHILKTELKDLNDKATKEKIAELLGKSFYYKENTHESLYHIYDVSDGIIKYQEHYFVDDYYNEGLFIQITYSSTSFYNSFNHATEITQEQFQEHLNMFHRRMREAVNE